VDVGPFVVADAQIPQLIEPGERPLDDPSPASQAAAMCVRRIATRGTMPRVRNAHRIDEAS
jgi:hypothetical protein